MTSLFAEKYSDQVEELVLLHPVRNLPAPACENMRKRAALAATTAGLSEVANTVAFNAISKLCQRENPLAQAFIRHLVATTNPKAYAAACLALATAPQVDATTLKVPLVIIGGEEDYLSSPESVKAWSNEVPNERGSWSVLKDVGHWGAIENPKAAGEALARAVALVG